MASVLPSPSDCCNTCQCNVISITLPCVGEGDGDLTVENTSALRLVLSTQRFEGMRVVVLSDAGAPFDGTGYLSVWRGADTTPDNPIVSVRPADIPLDADPGRFRQFI